MTYDLPYSLVGKRVWVAGSAGMLGSSLCRRLKEEDCEIFDIPRKSLDLCRQLDVEDWMAEKRPHAIFFAAGTVGGIQANQDRPGEFIYDNAMMAINVINSARLFSVEKLLILGSSCIYPRLAKQPMVEKELLTGSLEPTNESYAIAKIAALKLGQAFRRQYGCDIISAIPANLYGPGDKFHPDDGHVIPGLISRIEEKKLRGGTLVIWGTGKPQRDFLFVDDAADALVFLMKKYSDEAEINIGSGNVCSIAELVEILSEIMDFSGPTRFDLEKPDGMPLKQLDISRLTQLGWSSKKSLLDGLKATYRWYCKEVRN
ncbi:MAG: GDP-L-fucose synthase [Alphaproteobacteria bacterium MarineAlpha3_Bin5]|nr:GDP-fucose synthetase [Magnetovibrio sp.]PPR77236.1 MAG: GDP-L-fucose synthase [Alphaproteobacteria bacterium MarineAlpha3_Bin5]